MLPLCNSIFNMSVEKCNTVESITIQVTTCKIQVNNVLQALASLLVWIVTEITPGPKEKYIETMKKILYILFTIMLPAASAYGLNGISPADPDSLVIISAPALKDLVTAWSDDYMKSSGQRVEVRTVSNIPVSGDLKQGQICILQESEIKGDIAENETRIVVGRNIVVPVISAGNPYLSEIRSHGVSPANLKLLTNNQPTWGKLLNGSQENIARLHLLNTESVINAVSEFTGAEMKNVNGVQHSSAIDLFRAVSTDVYSVGFCRLSDLQPEMVSPDGLAILPIDKNGNGIMDSNEDIYTDITAFTRGVWIGKYPGALYSNIYSVFVTPVPESASKFMNWMITDGQNIIAARGYSSLILNERISGAARLANVFAPPAVEAGGQNIFRTLVIFIVLVVAGILIISFIRRVITKRQAVVPSGIASDKPAFNGSSLVLPKGVFFDKTHTWAFMEQDGSVKVGVDDFLLHITGPVTKLKLKKAGDKVKRGEEILSVIHNGKQLNLYSPVTGVIKEKNPSLDANIALINSSPYASGWVYRMEPENWQRENQLLFMAEKHSQFIMNEIVKIKDFIAGLMNRENPEMSLALQDGGMLREGVLSDMSPEAWEEFQTKIIDPSRTVWFYEII